MGEYRCKYIANDTFTASIANGIYHVENTKDEFGIASFIKVN